MNHIKSNLLYIAFILLLVGCKGSNKANETGKIDSVNVTFSKTDSVEIPPPPLTEAEKIDSVKLTTLVRALYKWHEMTPNLDGFKPITKNPADTLYSGIDLTNNSAAINELKKTGMFTTGFLSDYRAIAVRLDKELKDGSTIWQKGMLPDYHDDTNEWCKCQDYPDKYWEKLTLKDIWFNKDEASFKWTWGGDFSYKLKAKKEDDVWKISYMEGFDMNWYSWGLEKKKQNAIH